MNSKENNESIKYGITIGAIDFQDYIPITLDQFEEIRLAKKYLMFGLGIEEKFDLFIENYADFERTLINFSLECSIFYGKLDHLIYEGIHSINRRIVNLLTTARLYKDQLLKDFSRLYGKDSTQYKTFNDSISAEYDSSLGFKVMESLRNYVQHRNLPTHGIKFHMARDDSSEPHRIRHQMSISIDVKILEEDRSFKKVLTELKAASDKDNNVILVPFVREYADSFGRIHLKVRDLIAKDISNADSVIEDHLKKAKEKFGTFSSGVAAVSYDEQGFHKDYEYINDRFIKRRKEFEKKNLKLGAFSRHYVSSMCP